MKNVHIFTTTLPTAIVMQEAIDNSKYKFRDCEEDDYSTFGFIGQVEPMSNGYRIGFCKEEKVLPAAAVNRELNKRVGGQDLSKKELSEIRENVFLELVKKAMTKVTGFYAYYHTATNRLFIDTSNKDLAGRAISTLCHMLKSIETTTLHVSGVSNSLTQNIRECIKQNQELGFDGFTYDDKLHLVNSDKETVQFKCDYTLEHVADLIDSGYQVSRVRLYRDQTSFDLTDDFKIRQVKSLVQLDDDFYQTPEEAEIAEQEANLEIMSGIVSALINFLGTDKNCELAA